MNGATAVGGEADGAASSTIYGNRLFLPHLAGRIQLEDPIGWEWLSSNAPYSSSIRMAGRTPEARAAANGILAGATWPITDADLAAS